MLKRYVTPYTTATEGRSEPCLRLPHPWTIVSLHDEASKSYKYEVESSGKEYNILGISLPFIALSVSAVLIRSSSPCFFLAWLETNPREQGNNVLKK